MSSFHPIPGYESSSLKESMLIIPAVSLANLPQLAVDLLIVSLGLKRVGWIGEGETVNPFAGLGDDGEIVTGGLEVYGRPNNDLFIVQQRSPTIKSRKDAHVELLRTFILEFSFVSVIILTSLDAANQDDAQLLTPFQRILPPRRPSSATSWKLTSQLPPLSLSLSDTTTKPNSESSVYPPFLPGGGITRRLLAVLPQSLPHGCIAAWCVEGDNRGDAYALAKVVLRLIDAEEIEMKEPKSWAGLFGTTQGWSGGYGMDAELYG